ncbi:MAG: S41 family peptidase [Treponema sp.]|nr:S41 family peptidase [Treponema sp.]
MDEKNTDIKSWKFPASTVWVISTLIFCAIFTFTLAPQALAQSLRQNSYGNYTSAIRNVFEFIQRHYVEEIDPYVLFEGAMTGMFNALDDPYSAFLTEAEMDDMGDTTQGSFGGVGLYVTKPNRSDGRPNFLEVSAPIEDTPGWRAGINPGDIILQINGEPTDVLSSDEAVSRLRGQPGTDVRLLIRRDERIEFPITLTRAIIEVPTVKHDMIGNFGYLNIITFTPRTVDRCREAISYFQSSNYNGLILDLRNNYGGLLNSAVGVSNLFFEGEQVVSIRSRIPSENQTFFARSRPVVSNDIPIIVLINRASASASEIVAGALKDHGRAYLVGEKTFGKGSVQQVYPLNNAGFKLTTARYFTPSGANIDRLGIPPDREVLFPAYSEVDAEQLNSLMNSGRIAEYIRTNPEASSAQIEAFAQQLNRDFQIDISLLRRLIRNERNRTEIAPVFDLEYDVQLQEAVRILREENFLHLMQTSKTLRTLQEEATQDESFALAS